MRQPPIRLLNPIVNWVARLSVSLHTKLLVGFLLVSFLVFVVVGLNLWLLYRVEERALRAAGPAQQVARAGRMEYAVTAQSHFRAMHLLTGDPANDQKLMGARQDFSAHMGYLEGVMDGEGKALLAKLREANIPFQVHGQVVDRLAQAGDLAGALKVHLESEHPASHELEGLARGLVKVAEARWSGSLQEMERERRWGYTLAVVAGGGSLWLALFLGYVLSWPVLGAVGRLEDHLERVSRGDLSKEVQVANGDELQALAARSNVMMHEMARMRAELMEQNQALTTQARKMEDLNRTLEERVRQQTTELQAARRSQDPDQTITTTPRLSGAEAGVHLPGTYRCEACGATGRVSREVHGTIRCPRCQGTRFARVAVETG